MLDVEGLVLKFPSGDSPKMTLEICHPQNVMICIEQDLQILTVYEKEVPRVGFYYARVNYKKSSIQHCIARASNTVDEAVHIYDFLIKCQHPHVLKPTGIWICHNKKDERDVQEKKDEGVVRDGKESVRAAEAFITFPPIDGALVDVPKEDILMVEDGGFNNEGSRIFSDILDTT